MNSDFLKLSRIGKVFSDAQQRVCALQDISFSMTQGEYCALLGPSGSGKSTLLHIIGGLEFPTTGEIFFNGVNLDKMPARDKIFFRIASCGFVFQFYHLIAELTVLENVMLPALLTSMNRKQAIDRAKDIIQELGILDRISAYPAQLSGGEKQRTAFARALVNRPKLLLCDEPTGNLDPEAAGIVRNLLLRINQEEKIAIVLVTHNLELAKDAKRVLNIRSGILLSQ